MGFLNNLLSFFGIIFGLAIVVGNPRQSLFRPSTYFIIFAIFDVLLPSIIWTLTGEQFIPSWLEELSNGEIFYALLFYLGYYFILISFLRLLERNIPISAVITPKKNLEKNLIFLGIFFMSASLVKIGYEFFIHGGIHGWLSFKALGNSVRQSGEIGDQAGYLYLIPYSSIFQSIAALGFFFRKKLKNRFIFTYFFPITAILLSGTFLLRGTVINCLMCLIIAEYARAILGSHKFEVKNNFKRIIGKNILLIGLAFALSMYIYGSYRDSIRANLSGEIQAESDGSYILPLPTFITAGHGLIGVGNIIKVFGKSADFLEGKTYLDMLLLPIPRVIYVSKPAWYGIDDISKAMDWPSSTQSAVTMPGESYANFGVLGVFIAIGFAMVYGMLYRSYSKNLAKAVFLGPTIFFISTTIVNWMSFTGLMNIIPLFIFLMLIYRFAIEKNLKVDTAGKR